MKFGVPLTCPSLSIGLWKCQPGPGAIFASELSPSVEGEAEAVGIFSGEGDRTVLLYSLFSPKRQPGPPL